SSDLIKAFIVLGAVGLPCNNCKIGRANAAVLPVPVCAMANKSFFSNTTGIDCSCMGVGFVYPSVLIAFNRGSIRFNCSNVKLFFLSVISLFKRGSLKRISRPAWSTKMINFFAKVHKYIRFEYEDRKRKDACRRVI